MNLDFTENISDSLITNTNRLASTYAHQTGPGFGILCYDRDIIYSARLRTLYQLLIRILHADHMAPSMRENWH
jgi:hypothetical protein